MLGAKRRSQPTPRMKTKLRKNDIGQRRTELESQKRARAQSCSVQSECPLLAVWSLYGLNPFVSLKNGRSLQSIQADTGMTESLAPFLRPTAWAIAMLHLVHWSQKTRGAPCPSCSVQPAWSLPTARSPRSGGNTASSAVASGLGLVDHPLQHSLPPGAVVNHGSPWPQRCCTRRPRVRGPPWWSNVAKCPV